MDGSHIHIESIERGAGADHVRTGQWLFNNLPGPVAEAVRGTLFDPFYKDLTSHEIQEWIESHLIFNGTEIVGVFDQNTILWEE